ncbi:MAG: beta-lactamase family protein [Actinobacteria bacterium]|nr:beta-lactamase family protein [Actinomycetota bacterium]
MSPPDALREQLDMLVARAQAEQRSPSVSAAVFRDGEVVWRRAVGTAEIARDEAATPEHVYRIGSITKTFTAVCILQLRDDGELALDDPLRAHIPEMPPGPTIRDCLSHLSGLQREPPGEVWETLEPPSREELLAGLEDVERLLAPGVAWHYSNLAFGLLGEVVARRSESGYEGALRRRVLEPLGLERTSFDPPGPKATGYYVDPWSDGVTVEPDLPVEGPTAAMGWLWSTVDELAVWGDFLATGNEAVLAGASLDEMARVRTMVDHASWEVGWGLGLGLYRRADRVFVGHGGAMPGFLASVLVHRPERTGAAVLANTSAGFDPESLAIDLACAALEALPRAPELWRADQGAPVEVAPLLGRWWSEGSELLLTWDRGRLRLELIDGAPGRNVSWLTAELDDRWRIVEGRELGELLRVVRDDTGVPVKLYVATYPVTRAPAAFADVVGD